MSQNQRIQVSPEPSLCGKDVAVFVLFDNQDNVPLTWHMFVPGDDKVVEANRTVAQAIAAAMNIAPRVAIESIRHAARMATQTHRVSRSRQQLSAA